MAVTVNYRFQVAGHNAADWTTGNPLLADREWAVERDTGKVKLGDGVTLWNSLPYFYTTPTAALIGFTPAGALSSTNVQDALVELDAEKQPLDADLTTIAGLTATTDNFIVSVSSAWASRTPAQVRTTLGLVIGTDVQAFDADLTAVANSGIAAASTSFTPTVTSASGTITSYTSSGHYYIIGKLIWFEITITITAAGTGAGALIVSNMPATFPRRMIAAGDEDAISNHMAKGRTTAATTQLSITKYDGSTLIVTNARVQIGGCMEIS